MPGKKSIKPVRPFVPSSISPACLSRGVPLKTCTRTAKKVTGASPAPYTTAAKLHASAKKLYTSAGILHTTAEKLYISAGNRDGHFDLDLKKNYERNLHYKSYQQWM